jgi:hypothetical protein
MLSSISGHRCGLTNQRGRKSRGAGAPNAPAPTPEHIKKLTAGLTSQRSTPQRNGRVRNHSGRAPARYTFTLYTHHSQWHVLTNNAGRPIKNLPESVTVSADASAAQIYEEIAKASRFDIHRLRVTMGSDGAAIPNGKDVSVHETGVRNKSAVDVKDLGMHLTIHPTAAG